MDDIQDEVQDEVQEEVEAQRKEHEEAEDNLNQINL